MVASAESGIVEGEDGVRRCWWCDSTPEYRAYHDDEWGLPISDDIALFENLSLEGFQAGLSWWTILRKREAFRSAFAGFDLERVAAFGEEDVERMLGDAGIVRHRGKIEAVIGNAGRVLELIEAQGSLAAHVWSFEPADPVWARSRSELAERPLPDEAKALSRDLKRRGWRFVGPATVYAFMQAVGMVDDHLDGCAARAGSEQARAAFERPVAR